MEYEVEVVEVEPMLLAAATETSMAGGPGPAIMRLLDAVYGFVRAPGSTLHQTGHNVVLYFDGGSRVQAGVGVDRSFEPAGAVQEAATPGGRAARTLHIGPYSGLPAANRAVRDWCVRNGLSLREPCWEVYGDWNEDESKLETEVYYLLA